MVVGRHLEYFSHFKSYINENITLYEWPGKEQTGQILTRYDEIWQKYH